jgi:hypothetical protein
MVSSNHLGAKTRYFYYYHTVAEFIKWGALSDEVMVLYLQLLLALARVAFLRSESPRTQYHISLSQIPD